VKLSDYLLEELGSMVVGDENHFPYRSSYRITQFFESMGLPFKHDGSTRRIWAMERLAELNSGVSRSPDLPSIDLCKVISRLFDPDDFARPNKRVEGMARQALLSHFTTSYQRARRLNLAVKVS
jgi:hypothetical protein